MHLRLDRIIMPTQLELIRAYTKAIAGKDLTQLKALLHPGLEFTCFPLSLGIPVITGADNFLGAAAAMLKYAQGLSFEIIPDEVVEAPGRIWIAVSLFVCCLRLRVATNLCGRRFCRVKAQRVKSFLRRS